jgi:xanthosine utilization system XapX-like protein
MNDQAAALQSLAVSARRAIRWMAGGTLGVLGLLLVLLRLFLPDIAGSVGAILGLLGLFVVAAVVVRERAIARTLGAALDVVWLHGGTVGVHVGSPLLEGPQSQPAATFKNVTLHSRDGQSHAFLVRGVDVGSLLDELSRAYPSAATGYSDALLHQFVRDPASLERRAP